ncbi:MAG: hypothetical protein R3C01_10840 [Planctomycetaceae bacterium]
MSASHVQPRALAAPTSGWLLSPSFDLTLVVGSALLALHVGIIAVFAKHPSVVPIIFLFDMWLLGYHHVVSTFTRLCFDKKSFQEHRFLVIQLPLIVIGATAGAILSVGAVRLWMDGVAVVSATQLFSAGQWILPTTYLYWQWFHYTRQSYGIERMYRRNAGEGALINDYFTTRSLYLVAGVGILYRAWQGQSTFLSMEVLHLPITKSVLFGVAAVTAVYLAMWLGHSLWAFRQGRLAVPHFLYVCTHHIIFFVSYCLIDNITSGWLVLNVWHNLQYIMFVWWANNRQFKNEVDPERKLISTLSQKQHVVAYFGICIAISTVIFFGLKGMGSLGGVQGAVRWSLMVSMVMNFHHYVVDGIIWKRKKQKPAVTPVEVAPMAS